MIAVTLIVACGLAGIAALRSQPAALRHWVLAAGLACAAAVPLFDRVITLWHPAPIISLGLPTTAWADIPVIRDATASTRPSSSDRGNSTGADHGGVWRWGQLIFAVWIAGMALNFLMLAAGLGRLLWLTSRARPLADARWSELTARIGGSLGLRRPVAILQSEDPALIVTWGLRRPRVIVPASAGDWPDERMSVVLTHELAHIRRADWVTQMAAEIFRCVHWFNPVVLIATRRLRHESERACDDAVLASGVGAGHYANHLVALAREIRRHRRSAFSTSPAPAMVRVSSLERRVTAMLNARINRGPASPAARAISALALVVLTVVVVGSAATAQSLARLSGSVVDPLNGVVPEASISLTNPQTEAKYQVRSDASGLFEFTRVPAGTYVLEARVPGFATLTGEVTITGQDVQRRLALQLGRLSETVTVSFDPKGPQPAPAAKPVAARPAAARNVQACQVTSAGGNIRPPRKLVDVRPVYPSRLQGTGVAGLVVMEATITRDGTVRDVKVVRPADADLNDAAIDAVQRWEFDSTLLNCVPVEVVMTVTVNFTPAE